MMQLIHDPSKMHNCLELLTVLDGVYFMCAELITRTLVVRFWLNLKPKIGTFSKISRNFEKTKKYLFKKKTEYL